jgi:hypothetical protein
MDVLLMHSADHTPKVQLCMVDVMHQLIEESPFWSLDMTGVVLSQFDTKRQVWVDF